MKKALSLALVALFALALALPSYADTVGWDALPEKTEELTAGFSLSLTRLEHTPHSAFSGADGIIYGWENEYYAEYAPDNKGVVEGSPVRWLVEMRLPAESELNESQRLELESSGLRFLLEPSNMKITGIRGGYKLDRPGENWQSLAGAKLMFAQIDEKGNLYYDDIPLDRDHTTVIQAVITGRVEKTGDASAVATLTLGQSSFNTEHEFYFLKNGKQYLVQHLERYFYVQNTTDSYDYIVRFTVNGSGRISDLAVAEGDNHTEVCEKVTRIGNAEALDKFKQENDITDYEIVSLVFPSAYTWVYDDEKREPEYVKTWNTRGMVYGYVKTSTRETSDGFYSASKAVDGGALTYTRKLAYESAGYMDAGPGCLVANGAAIPAEGVVDGYSAPVPLDGTTRVMTASYRALLGDEDVISGGWTHKLYTEALDEIMSVLDFKWDGKTKYMQEKHFIDLFGNGMKLTAKGTWLGYEKPLTVG